MGGLDFSLMTLARKRSRTFSPASISGLVAWYDPSDLSTLFQDAAMTAPVTTAGQGVAAMKDKSGNGRHMMQATAAARPSYQTDGSLHWLAFDGVDDSFGAAAFAWGSDAAQIVFGLRKTRDSSIGCLFETSENSGNNNGTLAIFAPNASLNVGVCETRLKGTTQTAAITSGVSMSNSLVLGMVAQIGTDTNKLRINGAEMASATADQGSGNFGSYPIYLGRRANASFPFQGRVHGVALYNRVLTTQETASMASWMANKSGVTL